MSSYNLQAIQDKLSQIQNGGKPKKKVASSTPKEPSLPFWKPPLGDSQVRFLPFSDKSGNPFYTVGYYTSRLLIGDGGWRQVAPAQFGEEDPIFDLLSELSQKRQPIEVFKLMNNLRPKDSFYAPILVRGEEDKGVQVWELNTSKAKEILAILSHPDYAEDDLFDPNDGKDFIVTVTETDKTFMGHPVKDVAISERKKNNALAKTQAAIDDLVSKIPDFEAYFKGRLRPTDAYQQMLENALAGSSLGGNGSDDNESSDLGSGRNTSAKSEQSKSIDDAFADL